MGTWIGQGPNPYEFTDIGPVTIINISPKAVLVWSDLTPNEPPKWVPQSLCDERHPLKVDDEIEEFWVKTWWAEKNGLA